MEERIILLNGPPGVGKTSVGRALAATVENGACVHGDALRKFIVSRRAGKVQGRTTYRAAARVASVFVESGYELVVVDYVFREVDHLTEFQQELRRELRPDVPLFCFLLWAPLDVIQLRERTRRRRKRLGKLVEQSYAKIHADFDRLGWVIHTGDASVDEVTAAVTQAVERGNGRVLPAKPHETPQ
jgi:chloramphenicol 3-O-phosphotransferase